jgi:O-antigen/teichoic acid export membrane protein
MFNQKKIFENTSWLVVEKFVSLAMSLVVSIILARHLSPSEFGIIGYAMSLVSLFSIAGHMGLNGIVVRDVVKKPGEVGQILGSAFVLKLIGMFFGFSLIVCYLYFFEQRHSEIFYFTMIVSTSLLLRPFFVLEFWFHSQVKAKYISISNFSSSLIANLFKTLAVLSSLSILYVSAATLLQVLIAIFLLSYFYKKVSGLELKALSPKKTIMKSLLQQGWIVFLGSFFAIIYLKIDTVMLKWYVGTEEVGIYTVATQISQAWYFIPAAIVASVFPSLIKLEEKDELAFYENLTKLFSVLLYVAVAVAVVISFISDSFISLFFGDEYARSAMILTIHIWAAVFVFIRSAVSKWILIKGFLVFSLVTQGAGAFVNVLLNIYFIANYGAEGAAVSTLISYSLSSVFSLAIFSRTRPVFYSILKSIIYPLQKFLVCVVAQKVS